MRILHTADWHLGDRLGRIDRTLDLQRAVEKVGVYCDTKKVDVLLVAGDLFSELARPDSLRESIEHWQRVFEPFLERGGTVLTLTGNHDNENFCQTLNRAMSLAAPLPTEAGALVKPGRLYLATEPTLLRLADPAGTGEVQFVLMPYPTPSRYFRGDMREKYNSHQEKNQRLFEAFVARLREIESSIGFNRKLPAILAAHVNVHGAAVGAGLFRIAEGDDVLFGAEDLAGEYAYVALGHVHKPQAVGGARHIRYSGSIERMDLGEQADDKSAVLLDVGPGGLVGEPRLLPIEATPILRVSVTNPAEQILELKGQYPNAATSLVNLDVSYTAGTDFIEDVLKNLERIFPRWYAREWKEVNALSGTLTIEAPEVSKGFRDTVCDYIKSELNLEAVTDRDLLLECLEKLLAEVEA